MILVNRSPRHSRKPVTNEGPFCNGHDKIKRKVSNLVSGGGSVCGSGCGSGLGSFS